MKSRPVVWFVDDLPGNLATFKSVHDREFNVRTFSDPSEVVRLLRTKERPDALLCDVFFYETVEKAAQVEKQIADEAAKLRQTAHEIGADGDKYLAGIALIEAVAGKFKGLPPFPVYAYTSKGPYLLQQAAFDRIARAGATVLLKNRFGPQSERMLIQRDIDRAKEENSLSAKLKRYFKTVIITSGLLGVILDRLVKWLTG